MNQMNQQKAATNANNEKFWTSIPEGRQELAQQVGPLIENYYRSKKL